MDIVVCLKQVPRVSELPWDKKTGQLRRAAGEAMLDPASAHALELGLRLRQAHGGVLTAVSMGPPQAEEVLRLALAVGADRAALVSDPALAGADTLATSYTLAQAVRTLAPGFGLVLLGCHSSDSETGQVGPQLAHQLDAPCATYVESLELAGGALRVARVMDSFLETLELDPPAVITVATQRYALRDVPLGGVEAAFDHGEFSVYRAADIGAEAGRVGWAGSGGRIRRVYAQAAEKRAEVFGGPAKQSVARLLDEYGDILGGLIARDLGPAE